MTWKAGFGIVLIGVAVGPHWWEFLSAMVGMFLLSLDRQG